MSDSQRKELDAFFAFFATFDLSHSVTTVADLSDGTVLYEILSVIDAEYFRQPARASAQAADNWVLQFSTLKRIYRLLTQYFSDVLRQPTSALAVPDLQALAKDHDPSSALLLCRLTIAIAVQCEQNKEFIGKIQSLSETDQHYLMRAIEQVHVRLDDHFYALQSERSRAFSEKETLAKVYQALLDEHRQLQTTFDDVVSERDDAVARAAAVEREAEGRRNDKADTLMRAEIDRLRGELQKSEDNLALTETELDKQTSIVADLTRRVEDLQGLADEAARLKDQMDEYRHAADKLAKTENVMEKYKKKLQEGADLRQTVKSLEKQNADLVDKNASLEEEYRKVAAFKPLMESYKAQIGELEAKMSARAQELDTARFELDQTRTQLRITSAERTKDAEALELYQERVRELELLSQRPVTKPKPVATSGPAPAPGGDAQTPVTPSALDDELVDQSFGEELDNALSGTTMTDLKLQVRRLERELAAKAQGGADASRVLVLENLLEDATRAKGRYEADYLAAHREKLVLQANLEEIRSGKALGDGAEAAIALRQRLNETVDELDALKREHTALEVKHEALQKELTVAKSDLNLVNKDQLDILAALRESVAEDKTGLEAERARLREQLKELGEKNRLQLEQINGLLLEKVSLQSDSIGQRERMLARERDIGELRAALNGGPVPEDVKARVLSLHEDNVLLKEQVRTTQEKLAKARAFIKNQDKLFKEEHAKTAALGGGLGESDGAARAQLAIVTEERDRARRNLIETKQRYRKEQELVLSHVHATAMAGVRDQLGRLAAPVRGVPTSWLGQQRRNLGPVLRR
ncbi:HOOK-domain-containing protein [Vararia minispora EC-137]|uniref:HOOK-domain-containing protein n=1 Tax=Vararia minispora EC-137 TaxID=1314806 RepID=A0ACB8Q9X6_9AGAM|nr:HOOK-domain-containing protein [Vararia minispora EC-137]